MQIFQDRRALHRIPELDRQLPKTQAYLCRQLEKLGCRLFFPTRGSLCAYFDFGAGRTLALRSDMDGLPIQEADRPGASLHPGRMHACGHDGHMAILLETARRISEKKQSSTNVLLVFQPAEETTGGAGELCGSGIFSQLQVEAIFGLHIWPGLTRGKLFSRPGPMMARSAQIEADIFGQGSHIALPGADALTAGASLVSAAAVQDGEKLLKFGLFHSGTVCNARSSHARLEGSLRALEERDFTALQEGLFRAAGQAEKATGCKIRLQLSEGYPAVNNPSGLLASASRAADILPLPAPTLLTEDFGCYQTHLPGLFFFLGAGEGPALHSPDFDFPEEILPAGADFWEQLLTRWPPSS